MLFVNSKTAIRANSSTALSGMKKILLASAFCAAAALTAVAPAANAQKAKSIDEIIRLIQNDAYRANQDNKKREAEFAKDKASQQRLLNNAKAKLRAEQKRADQLTQELKKIAEETEAADARFKERSGDLEELFGHLKISAGELRENIESSIVSAQYPGRTAQIDDLIGKLSSRSGVVDIDEIQNLWQAMVEEMKAQGEVAKFNANVVGGDREVVRIGNFNLISNGNYLKYLPDTNKVIELGRQPKGYSGGLEDLQSASSGFTKVGIDPTAASGGELLEALATSTPTLWERVQQGSIVGYVILAVGALGIVIFILKFLGLLATGSKIRSQMKQKKAKTNNPLGRILKVAEANPGMDSESLELKVEEAVLKERPKIERGISFLKIISMIAPLLGLLGTVTGMIITFQAMTVYGAGDPTAMSAGISSALVTTVLGLVVAIPTVLMHTYLNSKATRLVQILDERSAGMIAERVEHSGRA